MFERQVVIPASREDLWDALTDPASLSAWFAPQVEWDLRPGGDAFFVDEDGSVRRGVIDRVLRGRHLSFRWWPEDGGDTETSEVTYSLESEPEGTRLTITEQPIPADGDPVPACATDTSADTWTRGDTQLFHCWALAATWGDLSVAAAWGNLSPVLCPAGR